MKKIHFFSGLIISIFIAIHLTNHLMSLLGEAVHITFMDHMRVVYRNLVAELVFLSAVMIQIISGVRLAFRKRKTVKGFFERLQIWTGLYLALFLVIHLSAILAGRYILNLDTNLYFGVAGLNTFPFFLFFAPYYGLAIMAFFGHIAAIHSIKMNRAILGLTVQRQATIILIIGICLSIATLYGLTNGFTGIDIPESYNILIGK